jgi:hypothetical protein
MNNFLNYKKKYIINPCSNCSDALQNSKIMNKNKLTNKIITPIIHKNNNNTLHFFPNLNEINYKK